MSNYLSYFPKVFYRLIFPVLKLCLNCIPNGFASGCAGILGYLSSFLFKREVQIATEQLKLAFPKLTKSQCKSIARGVFTHIGEFTAEAFTIEKLLQQSTGSTNTGHFKYISVSPDQFFFEAIKNGQAVLALSGHIGCFELLAAYYVKRGIPLSVIGRLPNYSILSEMLAKLRLSYQAEAIWREELGATRKIIKHLRSPHCIASLIDQDVDLEHVFHPFYSLHASYPSALIELAIRYNALILTTFIVRKSRLHHHVYTEKINYNPAAEDAVEQIVKIYSSRLEDIINRYPQQWIWWHRRWRRRPGVDYNAQPEQLRSTKDYLRWLKVEAEKERVSQ